MPAEKEPRRKRSDCKILLLPPALREQVERKIMERERYGGISDWLLAQGYEISKSAVCDYARDIGKAAQRIADDLAKTKAILDYIKQNPDVDAAKAAQTLMTSGLFQRLSTAEDEFLELPLDKAMRLVASIRRVDIAERKLTFEMREKIDLAFDRMEGQIMDTIKHDAALSAQLREILTKAKELIENE